MEFIASLFPYNRSVAMFGLAALFGSFGMLAVLELMSPARRGIAGREGRMSVNFGLGLFNMALSALLPISSLAMATWAQREGWGLFQHWPVGWYVALPLVLIAKSLLGYWLHRGFHTIAWLWPLHAVHHRDDAIDLSTSFRSHPLNHVLILLPNAALILVLGPDIWVMLAAEAVLLFAVLFHHANLQLPERANSAIERWLVTPRMHLVHHARQRDLHDSNYGDLFSFWDRVFGTYRTPPQGAMDIGVDTPPKPFWQMW